MICLQLGCNELDFGGLRGSPEDAGSAGHLGPNYSSLGLLVGPAPARAPRRSAGLQGPTLLTWLNF